MSRQQEDTLVEEDPHQHYDRTADISDKLGEDFREVDSGCSEEGLANLIASQTPVDELHHVLLAVEIAKRLKIFANHNSQWEVGTDGLVGNATGDDLAKLMQWKG